MYYQQLVVQARRGIQVFIINHLIKEDELVLFSFRCETFPVSDKRDLTDANLVAPVTMRKASF